jgi:hypothetical protein
MSRSAFAVRFTQNMGLSPIDDRAHRRMTLVMAALATPTLPMMQIAEFLRAIPCTVSGRTRSVNRSLIQSDLCINTYIDHPIACIEIKAC